jgi:transposase
VQWYARTPSPSSVTAVLPSRRSILCCGVIWVRFCCADLKESAMKKYRVTLTAEERECLVALIATGKAAAKKLTHARILLKADQAKDGPGWIDEHIAEALEVSVATIERVRQRFVEQGLEPALGRKKQDRPSRERKLDGAGEARLIALACSKVPKGRVVWTLQMLADKLVELKVVDSICPETVRQTLQKTNSSRG